MKRIYSFFMICLSLIAFCCSFVSTDGFIRLDNGDYVIDEETGSVQSELNAYGINPTKYLLGLSLTNEPIMMAENKAKSKVYYYFYVVDAELDLTSCDVATAFCDYGQEINTDDYVWDYKKFDLKLVGMASNKKLRKYEIEGLDIPVGDNRVYSVRQLYNNDTVIEVGMTYAINSQNETQVTTENMISIPQKEVWFDMISNPDSANGYYENHYYVAFDLSISVDKITKMRLSYDVETYATAYNSEYNITNIKYSALDGFFGNKGDFMKQFKGLDSIKKETLVNPTTKHYEELIKAGTTYEYENHLGFWNNLIAKWDSIAKVSEIDPNFAPTENVLKYQWIARFGEENNSNLQTIIGGKKDSIFDTAYTQIIHFDHVTNLTVFDIWYEIQGVEKHAIVADSYTASSGHQMSQNQQNVGLFDWIIDLFNIIVENFQTILTFIVIFGAVILVIVFAQPIFIVVKVVLKGIIFIVSLPFKLIGSIFTRKDEN